MIGLTIAVAAVLIILQPGCTNTIIPPSALQDPVAVFLVDYGRTPALVLPIDRHDGEFEVDRGIIVYVYGDWRYYAQVRRNALTGAAALLWPTQGAMGRRLHEVEPDLPTVQRRVFPGYTVYAIDVERAEARELVRRLDEQFQEQLDTRTYAAPHRMWFVHHPRKYTVLHNSNHRTAAWLRELGCEVRMRSVYSSWRIEKAEPEE